MKLKTQSSIKGDTENIYFGICKCCGCKYGIQVSGSIINICCFSEQITTKCEYNIDNRPEKCENNPNCRLSKIKGFSQYQQAESEYIINKALEILRKKGQIAIVTSGSSKVAHIVIKNLLNMVEKEEINGFYQIIDDMPTFLFSYPISH